MVSRSSRSWATLFSTWAKDRQLKAGGAEQNDPRSPDMLLGGVAVVYERLQSGTLARGQGDPLPTASYLPIRHRETHHVA
jgi:hypothetical protein